MLALAAPAWSNTGELTQKAGTDGCVSEDGTLGACADGKALNGAYSVAVSSDGAQVYVGSSGSDAVAVFDRDPVTGALTQKAGVQGCVSEDGTAGACADGTALDVGQAPAVAVSPDGANVYVASGTSDAVAVFDRDPATGALTQKAGVQGCISEDGTAGACTVGKGLNAARAVVVSPDTANVYVAGISSVAVFDRDMLTGALTQKAGTAGCVSEDGSGGACADGKALGSIRSIAVSPAGDNLYAASTVDGAVAVFDRDPVTGALTQKAGVQGCVSEDGLGGQCADGKALVFARGVTVSPDGANVYVGSSGSDAVVVFDRDRATGALTQKAGTAGCISEDGTAGECVDGTALTSVRTLLVSADGANLYLVSSSGANVAVFDRDLATGTLTQKAGTAGCISEGGTAGACADGKALGGAQTVAISPNGANVYVASPSSSAVAVFDRTPSATAVPALHFGGLLLLLVTLLMMTLSLRRRSS